MDEADALADRVGIMDHGKLLALDTPSALKRALPGKRTVELSVTGASEDVQELLAALEKIPGVENAELVQAARAEAAAGMMPGGFPGGAPDGGASPDAERRDTGELRLRLYVSGDAPALVAPAAAILSERKLDLTDIKLGEPSLEDVFIHLTGRALR
jgi:ABC-2 type transport system ATP-binding protein